MTEAAIQRRLLALTAFLSSHPYHGRVSGEKLNELTFCKKMGQTDMEVTVWEGRSSSLEITLFLVDQGKAFTTKGQTGYTRISLQSRG